MTRYTMPARSQGALYIQRSAATRLERDTHRWVFVRNLTPEVEVECDVRKRLLQRLNGFYCELQPMYTPRTHSIGLARTHMRSERKTIDEKGEG